MSLLVAALLAAALPSSAARATVLGNVFAYDTLDEYIGLRIVCLGTAGHPRTDVDAFVVIR